MSLAFVLAILGYVFLAYEHPYLAVFAILLAVVIWSTGLCFMANGTGERKQKEKVVVTSVQPQIDTTVTIQNGVADTTYTYHFYDYEKIK
jgi:predicted membrane protein